MRKITAVALLALGGAMWADMALRGNPRPLAPTTVQWFAAGVVVVLALMPGTAALVTAGLDRLRRPTPRGRAVTGVALWAACTAYVIFTAFRQERELYPRFHDEQMHLVSMRLLACFRLWTASHPLADFFDTFHVIVRPVYASAYFPGTSIAYVWEMWLHTPHWVGPAIVAGGVVAMTYRVVAELLDDAVLGWVAALHVLGVREFRYLSMVIMSHTVLMLLGLATVWAYLRWRRDKGLKWAAAVGAFAGWAAITRPLDALCYATPVGVAMGWALWRAAGGAGAPRWRPAARTAAAVVAAAAPFLAMQLAFDKGVSGRWLETPYQFYMAQSAPNLVYGRMTYNPDLKPQTLVVQKQLYDREWNSKALAQQAEAPPWKSWYYWKFRQLLSFADPCGMSLVMLPAGLMCLADRRNRLPWVLWGMLPCYVVGYAYFAFLLPHYCAVPSPGVALTAAMGVAAVRGAFTGAVRRGMETACVGVLVVASVLSLSEFTPRTPETPLGRWDDYHATPTMRAVAEELPKKIERPAVVLFRYNEGDNYNEEPVYNFATCNPDDALVIRAHDLGLEKDREIFDYYGRRQPRRHFYLFDRLGFTITPLGTAGELMERYPLTGGVNAAAGGAGMPTNWPATRPVASGPATSGPSPSPPSGARGPS